MNTAFFSLKKHANEFLFRDPLFKCSSDVIQLAPSLSLLSIGEVVGNVCGCTLLNCQRF